MGITLSAGATIVMKLGGLALTTSVLNSLLDEAGKKDWIVKVNIVAGVVAIITVYGVVKEAFDVVAAFMRMID